MADEKLLQQARDFLAVSDAYRQEGMWCVIPRHLADFVAEEQHRIADELERYVVYVAGRANRDALQMFIAQLRGEHLKENTDGN